MIDYSTFWQTLKAKKTSTYSLIKYYNLSSATIDKLRKDKPITTTTINDLSNILECGVADVLRYEKCEQDQLLYKAAPKNNADNK